jgi:1,4-dihydroxy-2-naphthoate octaprenyltransferase
MFKRKRIITTIVFLLSIVMTLVSAIVIKKPILVIIFILIQYCAYFWYSLSYIPYGRDIFCKCFKRQTGTG